MNELVMPRMRGTASAHELMLGLGPFALTLLFLLLASRHVKVEEDGRLERALAAGEPTTPNAISAE